MNELTVFDNAEFGQVRTTNDNGTVLFCATDVANALGYTNPQKAVRDHCKNGTERIVQHPQSAEKTIGMTFIPEGDVYRLIVRSNLPAAEKFERWVFDEVLPTIRKHGMWAREELLSNPDVLLEVVTRLKAETDARKALEAKNAVLETKAECYDTLVDRGDTTCLRDAARLLNIKEREFITKLLDKKYIYRDQKRQLRPYAKKNDGYFTVKKYASQTSNKTGIQTLITFKGMEHFAKLFAS